MITQTFNLNLIPDSAPVVVHVDQYDVGEGRFIIKLMNGDTPYTPVGATAVIQGMKPDGHGFIYAATISGDTVTADLVEQMSICAGNVRCQLVITDADDRTGTFVFIIAVQKSALPADSDMSTSDYQMVEQLIITAESINTNPPKIGANGNWWIWDVLTMAYVDSGVDASITVDIADITMLSPDATPYVTNTGTSTDPVFHLYIPRGQTGATGPAAGFGTPTASIDNNTGTPSVNISASGPNTAKVFDFAFHNLKGDKGDTGNTGATGPAAGFGTPTASIDANVGTPSVNVTASGPDTAKVFNFAFHNLKGADGSNTDPNAVHYGEQSKGYVGKNKLKISGQIDRTNVGVVCRITDSNRMTINGTSTGGGAIPWNNDSGYDIDLEVGKSYRIILTILDGTLTIDSGSSFYINKTSSGNLGASNFQAGTYSAGKQFIGNTFVATESRTKGVQIWMNAAGVVFTNCIIGWMICDANVTNYEYEPYLTPNTDLMSYAENAVLGTKNLHTFPYVNPSPTSVNGITYTTYENGSIDLNGTASNDADYVTHGRLINQANPLYLPKGKYVYYLAGETEDFGYLTLATTYNGSYSDVMQLVRTNGIGRFEITDNTNSDFKTPDGSVLVSPHIGVGKNKTLSHKIVWPVIELESTYNGKFTNGAMTNIQLTYDKPFLFHQAYDVSTTLNDMIIALITEYRDDKRLYSGKTITVAAAINTVDYYIVNMTQDNNRVMGYVITTGLNFYAFHYNLDNQAFNIKQATMTSA